MIMSNELTAPLQRFDRLGDTLGIELLVQRDDLLPFPLAGNKVRKIDAELRALSTLPDLLITNGGINSNHCRTLAFFATRLSIDCHLVLHGSAEEASSSPALTLLQQLGVQFTVVSPGEIRATIEHLVERAMSSGMSVHVVPGGAHSPAGSKAYAEVGQEVIDEAAPDFVFLASGTGATHGGIAAAAARSVVPTRVIGISVARSHARGLQAVAEAATWAGARHCEIEFDDNFLAGGYGRSDSPTHEAVALGWKHGLPLDTTYTGKAFAGLVDYAHRGALAGSRVLFWHTGGLWNFLSALGSSRPYASEWHLSQEVDGS